MRLTDHTDYSLRVLIYLNEHKTPFTLNEISQKIGVSKNNLIKVSNQLTKLGFIEATRGRNGGLLIKKETGRKNLKEIIMSTEASFSMAECFTNKNCECCYVKKCALKKSLSDALNAFLETLSTKTLNDITP